MSKKKKPAQPSEIPLPAQPEIKPQSIPEEPTLPEKSPIAPEPNEPSTPPELPETK